MILTTSLPTKRIDFGRDNEVRTSSKRPERSRDPISRLPRVPMATGTRPPKWRQASSHPDVTQTFGCRGISIRKTAKSKRQCSQKRRDNN
ncbi:unnamed protein product, partial [Nesidiocoris tenuis]